MTMATPKKLKPPSAAAVQPMALDSIVKTPSPALKPATPKLSAAASVQSQAKPVTAGMVADQAPTPVPEAKPEYTWKRGVLHAREAGGKWKPLAERPPGIDGPTPSRRIHPEPNWHERYRLKDAPGGWNGAFAESFPPDHYTSHGSNLAARRIAKLREMRRSGTLPDGVIHALAAFARTSTQTSSEAQAKHWSGVHDWLNAHPSEQTPESLAAKIRPIGHQNTRARDISAHIQSGSAAALKDAMARHGDDGRAIRREMLDNKMFKGLGAAKSSFILQLLGYDVGCLDGRVTQHLTGMDAPSAEALSSKAGKNLDLYEALESRLRELPTHHPADPDGMRAGLSQWRAWDAHGVRGKKGSTTHHVLWNTLAHSLRDKSLRLKKAGSDDEISDSLGHALHFSYHNGGSVPAADGFLHALFSEHESKLDKAAKAILGAVGDTINVNPPDKNMHPFQAHVTADHGDSVTLSSSPTTSHGPRVPKASLQHFGDDLNGVVRGDPSTAPHPAIAGVLRGEAKHLGKGNDAIAFEHGNHVVKVSTGVPYQPFNPGHKTPEQAASDMEERTRFSEDLRKKGVPGLLPTQFYRHGDKGFQVQPKVEIPQKLERRHLDEAQDTVKALHEHGYALRDEPQVGIHEGHAVHYDTGSMTPLHSQPDRAQNQRDDDLEGVDRLYKKHGFQSRHSPEAIQAAHADFEKHMGQEGDGYEDAYYQLAKVAGYDKDAHDRFMRRVENDRHGRLNKCYTAWTVRLNKALLRPITSTEASSPTPPPVTHEDRGKVIAGSTPRVDPSLSNLPHGTPIHTSDGSINATIHNPGGSQNGWLPYAAIPGRKYPVPLSEHGSWHEGHAIPKPRTRIRLADVSRAITGGVGGLEHHQLTQLANEHSSHKRTTALAMGGSGPEQAKSESEAERLFSKLPSRGLDDLQEHMHKGVGPTDHWAGHQEDGRQERLHPYDPKAHAPESPGGHGLTEDHIRRLAGVPDGWPARVHHSYNEHEGHHIGVTAWPPGDGGGESNLGRDITFNPKRGAVRISNNSFEHIDPDSGEGVRKGAGLKMLLTQAHEANKLHNQGMRTSIETTGAGSYRKPGSGPVGRDGTAKRSPSLNGYYTWPQLGYHSGARAVGPHGETMKHLLTTKEGMAWWRLHGRGLGLQFDTHNGSYSMKRLEHYARHRLAPHTMEKVKS